MPISSSSLLMRRSRTGSSRGTKQDTVALYLRDEPSYSKLRDTRLCHLSSYLPNRGMLFIKLRVLLLEVFNLDKNSLSYFGTSVGPSC